jgi:3-oxoacyl-[acyl-carrier protein] reductase
MTEAKTVLVTGGASGIGWATACEFAQKGWNVVIGDIDEAAAREKASQLRGDSIAVSLDVCKEASVTDAMQEIASRYGQLDALINNAGVQKWSPIANMDWDAWNWVLDVNLNGVMRCLSAACALMEGRGGSVVNIVSINAERGVPLRAPYTAAKAAVIGLTRSAAIELAPKGIRVNAVGPGYVATELIERFISSGQMAPEPILKCIPMNRFGEPGEIAKVIGFLASDDASYVTGQVLYADGGFLANSGLPGASEG